MHENHFLYSTRHAAPALLSLALLSLGSPGVVSAHEGHAALPSTGATIDGNKILISAGAYKGLDVQLQNVTLNDLNRQLQVQARVELPWSGQAKVSTLVPGRVRSLLVKPGETVTQGQLLAEIESLDLGKMQFALLQAGEELAMSRQLLEQQQKLVANGTLARKSLLETEAQLHQHEVQIAIQRRKLRAMGLTLEQVDQIKTPNDLVTIIPVTSPTNGVISHADVRLGAFVDTEQHLFDIVDHSQVLITGHILEADAERVKPGQPVSVRFPALGDKPIPGQIARLRLAVNTAQRTLDVVVPVENPALLLQPGMTGRMEIEIYRAEQAIVCPASALIQTGGRTFLLKRIDEGKFERKEVQVGMKIGNQLEILKGLFPGDRVVVTGTRLLASMFHTDIKPGYDAGTVSVEPPSEKLIPLASAVVELPTSRKGLATPVIEGRVVSIRVQPGQWVKQGTVLAELESQELRNLQMELLETQVKLEQIRAVIARVAPLVERNTYKKSQFWEHQLEEKTLAYRLEEIKSRLTMVGLSAESIQTLLTDTLKDGSGEMDFVKVPVTAPADGFLADFRVVPGEVVHADDVLFELQNPATIWVQAYVQEEHAGQVQIGQTAELTFAAFPDTKITGQVIRVSPTLHASARVLPLWIEIENPDGRFREGMRATGRLQVPVTAPLARTGHHLISR